jgi:hypothetical protein
MKSFKHWYVFINFAVIFFGGGLLIYWQFIDGVINPVIRVLEDPMVIETTEKVYHPGDEIYISYKFCKLRDIEAVTNWRLVDGQVILFAPITKRVPLGCYGTDKPYITRIARVPLEIESGVWHLEGETTFRLNPINSQAYERKTVEFIIDAGIKP